jgi:hypothetical protein
MTATPGAPVQNEPTDTLPAIHPEDPDDDWLVPETAGGLRIRRLTAALGVVALLGAGFWGGVVAEKHHGSGSTTSSLASRFAALRSGTGTGTSRISGLGTGGSTGAGTAAGATTGTVVGVNGNVLFVSDSSGNLVKVTVGPSATITRTGKAALSDLQVGDSVVVAGSTGAGGTVTATSVRASAAGVSSGGGGFGGGAAGAGFSRAGGG